MRVYGQTKLKPRLGRPGAVLGIGLTACCLLVLAPARWTQPAQGVVAMLLLPGQHGAMAVRGQVGRLIGRVQSLFQTASRLADAESELDRLRQENRRLAAELAAAHDRSPAPPTSSPDNPDQRLLRVRGLEAWVLGRQAMAFLGRHQLLNVGRQADVQPEALVAAPVAPAVIDRGRDCQLKAGHLVLAGHAIWGRIVEVGPCTSVVRTVTEPGYRDLVRLVSPEASPQGRQRNPQGILEGAGQALAKIRLVEVTEPVSVGDLVYAAADRDLMPEPLLYGRVARLQRPPGAAHWEIWMEPAVPADVPQRVAVLRIEFSPLRVAGKGLGALD